ncbi:hypothetical protein [Citrobacter freundii]|uniref:hypothetical protein n=1 Tax=Citrobacter freundii TaxID=546 RepID=UPI001FFE0762|nr:hypothetical protein [Citrobacter freundii]
MKPDVKKIIADIKATKGNRKFCNGLAGTLQDDNYASSICKYVKTVTPERIDLLIEYAEKLEAEVTDMAVQLANAESKCRELAAENAGLKSGGAGFFAYSEETGFETHKTKAEAITSAEDMIGVCREEASSDGWPEDADSICWGIILQKAVEGQFEKPAEENGWIGWSEYSLSPSTETPATDVYLAEVRAQGVDMLTANRKSEWMDSYIDDANEFAAQLRKGAAL